MTLGSQVEKGQDNIIYVRMRNRGASAANGVRATVYWSPVSTLVSPNLWTMIGTTPPVNVPTGNTLVVAPGVVWAKANIPAAGHYCFIAVLDQAADPAPGIPGPTDWTGFIDIIRNNNNVTWRNFNVVDVLPDPSADPIAMPFLLAGAYGEARRFDFEIEVHVPEDVRVHLELPAGAARALPSRWRESSRCAGKDRRGSKSRGSALSGLCGVSLFAGAAHECRFIVEPTKSLGNGLHTIAIRQYDGDRSGSVG